jgi:hypothetical protein
MRGQGGEYIFIRWKQGRKAREEGGQTRGKEENEGKKREEG